MVAEPRDCTTCRKMPFAWLQATALRSFRERLAPAYCDIAADALD